MTSQSRELSLVLQNRLEHILSLESVYTPQDAVVELCRSSAVLWADTAEMDKYLFLIQAAQIYSFATTEVKDDAGRTVKKWQVTQIPDENGALPERARSWKQFCIDHLRIHPTQGTGLKRTWEVFRVSMGYDFDTLVRAGKAKLTTAVGTVASLLPAVHESLLDALFGNDHKCVYCKHIVDYQDAPPLSCPKCGAEWSPVPPASLAQVILLIGKIKKLQQDLGNEDDPSGKAGTEGNWHYDEVSQEVVWVGFFVQENERIPLPAWKIPVFDDDTIIPADEMGVHFGQIPALREALAKGLKQ